MRDDEPFLHALTADPDDRTARRVYADWLAERDRADEAEYVRLAVRAAELPPGADRVAVRTQLLALQQRLPRWWCATVGGLRATPDDEPDFDRHIEEVARVRGRPTQRTDDRGFTLTVEAAATNPRTGAVAYLESRSKWEGHFHDIHYHLHLRRADGHVVTWEPHTYNPYFGCDTKFLEWYGDAVLFIYREKHAHYAARFGFDGPARFQKLATDYWLLDGRELGFIVYRQAVVNRLSVPDLEPLPALSIEDATARDLMPQTPAWWQNG
jgi:uncharacterized protein (TIGR02996 family)